uniref:FAM69 protein-kinase domain-containing protein n=1 Tax=Ciona savignyi TaxID=51511 RepID=H2YI39_CIOSA
MVYRVYKVHIRCNVEVARNDIKILCDAYNRGDVIGDFCSPLCSPYDVTINYCLRHDEEEWRYSAKNTKSDEYFILNSKNDDFITSQLNDEELFNRAMLLTTGDSQIRKSNKSYGLFSNFDSNFSRPELLALTGLLSQNRFQKLMTSQGDVSVGDVTIMTKSLGVGYFPKILGTCGDYYVTEHVIPVSQLISVEGIPQKVISLANTLDRSSMYACDVINSTIGIDRSGKAVLLETNRVFSKEILEILLNSQSCSNDDDCTMMQCSGVCDVTTGRCKVDDAHSNLNIFQRTI